MPRAGVRAVEFKFGDVLTFARHDARVLFLCDHPTYTNMFQGLVLRPGKSWSAIAVDVGYVATQNYRDGWVVDESWPN